MARSTASVRVPVPKGQKAQFGKIEMVGYTQFIKAIRTAEDKGVADAKIRAANEHVAQIVITKARSLASTKMEKRAAGTLVTSKKVNAVAVVGGAKDVPYFGGANFGSHRNQRRIIKKPNVRGTRSRATKIRDDEDLDMIVKRVERQRVSRSGKTTTKKEGGFQVKVERTANGNVRVIRGWNQFPIEWAKGKDQFLYRAVTMQETQIIEEYQRFIDTWAGDAFNE